MNKPRIRLFIKRYIKFPYRNKKIPKSWTAITVDGFNTIYFDYSISRIKYE